MTSGRAAFDHARASLEIGLARLHGAVPADRDRLRHQLDAVRPAAIGVPDRAILFVPRLVARKRLPLHGDGGLFAENVAEGLRGALRRARRPGEAHSRHDSLLFLDEPEAAACLIEQWLAGVPPADRAWWPHFTAGAAPPVWWRRHILPDPRRLPALVARLARRGLAEAWLERLAPDDVQTALTALAAAQGLPLPQPSSQPQPQPRPAPASRRAGGKAQAATPDLAEALALVEAVVPEARRTVLPPPARLLLILALLAERRPALLSTRGVKAFLAAAAAGRLPSLPEKQRPVRHRPSPTPRRTGRKAAAEQWAAPSPATEPPLLPAAIEEEVEARPIASEPCSAPPPGVEAPRPAAVRLRRPAAVEAAPAAAEIATEYGGLLFLLNALLALGIYGDFSQPHRSLPGLSPFGLLRLLGRAWFGESFIRDPLHGLLVCLAGGPRADAARDFEAPPWSVPRSWLAPWPEGGRPLAGGDKLRPMLWHAAGFPLAELDPADPGAGARAARRLGLRAAPRPARRPRLPAPARARWISCLRFYLEARIARALGCEDRSEAMAMLCRRPARIIVEGDELGARFALDDHPLAIRLTGLDRDPGWIPAARRSLRYRFE